MLCMRQLSASRGLKAGLLKLENVAQLLQCEGWNEGQACGNACDWEKEGMWRKERWENKSGGEEGRKREEEEEQRHTLCKCVNVIGCFVFQCHPQIQMFFFFIFPVQEEGCGRMMDLRVKKGQTETWRQIEIWNEDGKRLMRKAQQKRQRQKER